MQTLKFNNLVEASGKTIEIEVPDGYIEDHRAGARGRAFGLRVKAAAKWDTRMANALASVIRVN